MVLIEWRAVATANVDAIRTTCSSCSATVSGRRQPPADVGEDGDVACMVLPLRHLGLGPRQRSDLRVFFIFAFFKKKNYRNIFLVLDFTVLYPYRQGGGRGATTRQGAVGTYM